MKKDFRLSVSQLKKLNKSVAMWAGLYIMEIKEFFDNTNTIVGSMFHKWIETGNDKLPMETLNKHLLTPEERDAILEQYNNLKEHYAYYPDVEPWDHEVKIDYEYLWLPFVAYIDNIPYSKRTMKDWKSVTRFADKDATYPNHWSDMTTYQEYALQAWQYMIASGIKRMEFVEFLKNAEVYQKVPANKKKTHKVWDRKIAPEDSHNIIVFERSEEWNKEMSEYWNPKMEEAKLLWDKFKPAVQDIE